MQAPDAGPNPLMMQRASYTPDRSGIIGIKIVATLIAAFLAIALLIVANSSPNPLDMTPTQSLMAASFFLTMIALTLTSISTKIQLCYQIAYIYFAIYLVLPGFNHASQNLYPFYSLSYPPGVQQQSALIVTVFCVTLILTQILGNLVSRRRQVEPAEQAVRRPNPALLVMFWLLLMGSLALFLSVGGLEFAFSPRNAATLRADSVMAGLGIAMPRAISGAVLAYAIFQARRMTLGWAVVTLLAFGLPSIILNFPLSLPRATLFGLILFCAFGVIDFGPAQRRAILSGAFVFGAVVAMPVVDSVSRGGKSLTEISTAEVFDHYFESGDFDGLQSINNAVLYTSRRGLQYGNQIASSLLFFVPRGVWPSKAEPTGAIAAKDYGMKFTNLSEPLPGEFYTDFGLPGVVLGAMFIGWLMSRLDRWIDRAWGYSPEARYAAGAFVGYSLLVFRGSLQAVIGPAALIAIICVIVALIGFRKARPVTAE